MSAAVVVMVDLKQHDAPLASGCRATVRPILSLRRHRRPHRTRATIPAGCGQNGVPDKIKCPVQREPSGNNPEAYSETDDRQCCKQAEEDDLRDKASPGVSDDRKQHVQGANDGEDGRVKGPIPIETGHMPEHANDGGESRPNEKCAIGCCALHLFGSGTATRPYGSYMAVPQLTQAAPIPQSLQVRFWPSGDLSA